MRVLSLFFMKLLLVILFITPLPSPAQPAQKTATVIHGFDTQRVNKPGFEAEIFRCFDNMPQPEYDTRTYLAKNMKYPKDAADAGLEGRVVIEFIVTESGRIDSPKVIRSLSASTDAEALRLVKNMPPWKPGMDRGKQVKVRFVIPVIFKLE